MAIATKFFIRKSRQLQRLTFTPYVGVRFGGSFGIRTFVVSFSHSVLNSTESSLTPTVFEPLDLIVKKKHPRRRVSQKDVSEKSRLREK